MVNEASERELRRVVLYEHLLSELRSAERFPTAVPPVLPPEATPATFDDLYEHRRDYQEGRTLLTRDPTVQQWYLDALAFNEQVVFAGRNLFEAYISEVLAREPIVIAPSRYPYDLPPEALHFVMWYRDETTEQARATYLLDLLEGEGAEERDIVLMRNPPHRRSIRSYSHVHAFVRRKPTYTILKPWVESMIESGE